MISPRPGDFRENVVVDLDDLNALPSGTELQIGTAAVRLTLHCEPCSRVTRSPSRRSCFITEATSGLLLPAVAFIGATACEYWASTSL